jgi:RNA polymerase sigma factor (TIGR02999 family)
MEAPSQSITQLLRAWNEGDQQALDELIPLVYGELRRIARHQARRLPKQTLQPTELIHEAFAQLAEGRQIEWQDRAHFFAVCARMMRFILIDRLRRRQRYPTVPLNDVEIMLPPEPEEDLLALDEALSRLERLDKQQSLIVELRYFGGLTIDQTAEVLQISPATVKRDWSQAKRWLKAEIEGVVDVADDALKE